MQTLAKVLGAIVVIVLLVMSTIYVFSTQTLNKSIQYTDTSPAIPRDSAAL